MIRPRLRSLAKAPWAVRPRHRKHPVAARIRVRTWPSALLTDLWGREGGTVAADTLRLTGRVAALYPAATGVHLACATAGAAASRRNRPASGTEHR